MADDWSPPDEAFTPPIKKQEAAWRPPAEAFIPKGRLKDTYLSESLGALKTGAKEFAQGAVDTVTGAPARYREGVASAPVGARGEKSNPMVRGAWNAVMGSPAAELAGAALEGSGGVDVPGMYASHQAKAPTALEKPVLEKPVQPPSREVVPPLQREAQTPQPATASAPKWQDAPIVRAKPEAKEPKTWVPEKVAHAYVEAPDGTVFTGITHSEAAMKAEDAGHDMGQLRETDGFVTSRGRKITRKEAKVIADAQKQVEDRSAEHLTGDKLHSEQMMTTEQRAANRNVKGSTLLRPGSLDKLRAREAPPVPIASRGVDLPQHQSAPAGGVTPTGRDLVAQQRGESGSGGSNEPPLPGDIMPYGGGSHITPPAKTVEEMVHGKVDRFLLRDTENIIHRMQGREHSRKMEVSKYLETNKDKIGSDFDKKEYEYGEGKPGVHMEPHEEAETREGQRWDGRNTDIYRAIQKLSKSRGYKKELLEEVQELNPKYMHRHTDEDIKKYFGQGEEPGAEGGHSRGGWGMYRAPQTKPRRFFGIESSGGAKGIVYVKDGSAYLTHKDPITGVVRYDKIMNLPKGFDPRPGATFGRGGVRMRLTHAISEDIEKATDIKYDKSAIRSRTLAYLNLSKMEDQLSTMNEIAKHLSDRGVASSTKRAGWQKTEYPGLGHLYMPERVAKHLNKMMPRQQVDESAWEYISRATQKAVATLFWNPLVHIHNVAVHHIIERGFRNFNPKSNWDHWHDFSRAWKATSEGNADYRALQNESASLQYWPERARRELQANMLRGLESPESNTILSKIAKYSGVKLGNRLRKSIMENAGDAMWFGSDVLTQAAIFERNRVRTGESLRTSVRKIHRDLPSYRTPVEEILPNKAGRLIGDFASSPITKTFVNYIYYHENVIRGVTNIAEDLIQAVKSIRKDSPNAKEHLQDGIDALGKIAAIGALFMTYKGMDEATKMVTGNKDDKFRRGGTMAILDLIADALSKKHLTEGSKARLATGGLFSPSPVVELGANIFGGRAYSMSPIQPEGKPGGVKYHMRAGDVPYGERLGAMAGSVISPIEQIRKLMSQRPSADSALDFVGLLGHARKTQRERDQEKIDRRYRR